MRQIINRLKEGLAILGLALLALVAVLLCAVLVRPLMIVAMVAMLAAMVLSFFSPGLRAWLEAPSPPPWAESTGSRSRKP